ncbi:hypothetical protein AWRI1631_101870, partial [Saccharomyces cerevisiae AWRI1631]
TATKLFGKIPSITSPFESWYSPKYHSASSTDVTIIS